MRRYTRRGSCMRPRIGRAEDSGWDVSRGEGEAGAKEKRFEIVKARAKKIDVATMDRVDRRERPQSIWPDVQPDPSWKRGA